MMRKKRLTVKPLPRSQSGWKREYDGTLRFIHELEQIPPETMGGWARKQLSYYNDRLTDLLAHIPRGLDLPE